MVARRLARARDDLERALRVEGRLGADLVEEVRRHRPRAGERREQAVRTQQLHREEVDVLVPARRAHQSRLRVGELRRVEDDEVERPPLVAVEAQLLEDIRLHEVADRGGGVERGVLPRKGERARRHVEVRDRLRAPRARRKAEAARVGEAVEHVRVLRKGPHRRARVALVEVEPRLVPPAHIDEVADRPLLHLDQLGRLLAREEADLVRAATLVRRGRPAAFREGRGLLRSCAQALARAGVDVAAVVDAPATGHVAHQGLHKHRLPELRARARELDDGEAVVDVGDHAGEAVALGVDDAHGVRPSVGPERRAAPDGVGDEAVDERRVRHGVRAEAQHPHADLAVGRVGPVPQAVALRGADRDRLADARRPLDAADRPGEDPGMAMEGRVVALCVQDDLVHDPRSPHLPRRRSAISW